MTRRSRETEREREEGSVIQTSNKRIISHIINYYYPIMFFKLFFADKIVIWFNIKNSILVGY